MADAKVNISEIDISRDSIKSLSNELSAAISVAFSNVFNENVLSDYGKKIKNEFDKIAISTKNSFKDRIEKLTSEIELKDFKAGIVLDQSQTELLKRISDAIGTVDVSNNFENTFNEIISSIKSIDFSKTGDDLKSEIDNAMSTIKTIDLSEITNTFKNDISNIVHSLSSLDLSTVSSDIQNIIYDSISKFHSLDLSKPSSELKDDIYDAVSLLTSIDFSKVGPVLRGDIYSIVDYIDNMDLNIINESSISNILDELKNTKYTVSATVAVPKSKDMDLNITYEKEKLRQKLIDIIDAVRKTTGHGYANLTDELMALVDNLDFSKSYTKYAQDLEKEIKKIEKTAGTLKFPEPNLLSITTALRDVAQNFYEIEHAATRAAESIVDSYMKSFNFIKKLPFGDALYTSMGIDSIKKGLNEKIKETLLDAFKTGTLNLMTFRKIFKESLVGIKDAIISIGKHWKILLPLGLIYGIYKGFQLWQTQLKTVMETTGLLYNEAEKLAAIAIDAAATYGHMGVSLEVASKSAGSIFNQFRMTNLVTEELLKTTSLVSAAIGLSTDESTKLMSVFKTITNLGDENLKYATGYVKRLALAANVAPSRVMKDIAESSETIYSFMSDSVPKIAAAAVEAARLGTSLKEMGQMADSLLDWDTSIQATMEASVLLGRSVDFSRARMLAFNGDLRDMTKEIMNQVGSLEEFMNMNVFQRRSLAKAAGMNVEQLSNMLRQQKAINNMLPHETAEYEAIRKELEIMRDVNKDSILDENRRQLVTEKFMAAINRIGYSLMNSVVPALEIIADIIGVLVIPLVWIGDAINLINEGVQNLAKALPGIDEDLARVIGSLVMFGSILTGLFLGKKLYSMIRKTLNFKKMMKFPSPADVTSKTKAITDSMSETVSKSTSNIKDKLSSTSKDISKTSERATSAAKSTSKSAGGFIKKLANGMVTLAKGIGNSLKELAKGIGGVIYEISKAIGSSLKFLAKGIGSSIEILARSIGKGIGLILKGIASGLRAMGDPKVIMGALALAIIAGSTYVFALAFKEFTDIDWGEVFIGIGAMTTLGLVAAALGAIGPMILLGAVSLAALSGALYVSALAFKEFTDIDWGNVWAGIGTITALAAIATAALPAFIIGAIGLGIFSVAMYSTGKAASVLAEGLSAISNSMGGVTSIMSELVEMSDGLFTAASAIFMLAGSIGAFATAMSIANMGSIGDSILGLFGGSFTDKLSEIVELGPGLTIAANGMKVLSDSIKQYSNIEPEMIQAINQELKNTVELAEKQRELPTPQVNIDNKNEEIINKLDELINVLSNMGIEADGIKIAKLVNKYERSDLVGGNISSM